MNYSNKKLIWMLLICFAFTAVVSPTAAFAFSANDILGSTLSGGGGLANILIGLLLDKFLAPLVNIFGGKSSSEGSVGTPVKPTIPPVSTSQTGFYLRGKVIVIDPGHGGSNPGAVGNGTRESDNNLAVGLNLRDKLVQAGAKVIMTRDSDRTVAPEGSTLGQELQARVDIAERNHADIFVSIHSNANSDSRIKGAMTFYPSGKADKLASSIQTALVKEIGAVDKGIESATFHVLRNAPMPSVLVEMGFVTNVDEAALLRTNAYRNSVAQGVFNGIGNYFNNN